MCNCNTGDPSSIMSPADAMTLLLTELERLRKGDQLLKDIHMAVVVYGEGNLSNELYARLDNFVMGDE